MRIMANTTDVATARYRLLAVGLLGVAFGMSLQSFAVNPTSFRGLAAGVLLICLLLLMIYLPEAGCGDG